MDAAAPLPATPAARVLVAGAGPAGMVAALELARAGIPSTVFEAGPRDGTRDNLVDIAPSTQDELSQMGLDDALAALQPVRMVTTHNAMAGIVHESDRGDALQPDASRGDASIDALLDSIRGQDPRAWGRVAIGTLEDALRGIAERDYPDLVELRFDTTVTAIGQDADTVRATVQGSDGSRQVVEGSYLVSATGGRSPLGVAAVPSGPTMEFVGARLPASRDTRTEVAREVGDGSRLTPRDQLALTIGLHGNGAVGHSMAWVQLDRPAGEVDPDALRQVVAERAAQVGLELPDADAVELVPVTVQLGGVDQAVHGRVLLVGDELQLPYFPNSTGANAGVVTARAAAMAIAAAAQGMQRGEDPSAVLAEHDARTVAGAQRLLELNRTSMDRALGAQAAVA